tara:strand:- start:1804 stop:2061 length:258 start_codon:yes stop_codon:yes gene_type:complete
MIETSTETKKEFVPTDDMELIDDAFYVQETRFMWKSVLKDGKDFLFGLKKEDVVSMSRWHLKCLQEGTLGEYTRVVNDGKVGGKL